MSMHHTIRELIFSHNYSSYEFPLMCEIKYYYIMFYTNLLLLIITNIIRITQFFF